MLKSGVDEGIGKQAMVSTESSLNDVSDLGNAFVSQAERASENDVEIRQIFEESLEETTGNVSASEKINNKKSQSGGKAKRRTKASNNGKPEGIVSRGNVIPSTRSLDYDAYELNEEDWGSDYDLPL